VAEPVNATQVPAHLGGFRLISNALHHFAPEQARALLADAVAQRRGIAVFEALSRSLLTALGILPSPLIVLATAPFIRPFHWSRLLWTYAVPVVPLACLWDGMISVLRIYSPEELQALVAEVPGSDEYVWDIGRLRVARAPARITYLIGRPR
jgi:small-conductance mechanosensitive channel